MASILTRCVASELRLSSRGCVSLLRFGRERRASTPMSKVRLAPMIFNQKWLLRACERLEGLVMDFPYSAMAFSLASLLLGLPALCHQKLCTANDVEGTGYLKILRQRGPADLLSIPASSSTGSWLRSAIPPSCPY